MKKILSLLMIVLTFVLSFTLASCEYFDMLLNGEQENSNEESNEESSVDSKYYEFTINDDI